MCVKSPRPTIFSCQEKWHRWICPPVSWVVSKKIGRNFVLNVYFFKTDRNYLLCCTRDDALHNFELRMNRILHTYAHENFKVGLEFTRCSFSPDAQYCVAGSGEGELYIWNVATAKVESVLSKEHE